MERFLIPLLVCTSWVTAQFNVTRQEKADTFLWRRSGSSIDCGSFTDGTATWYGVDACECNSGWTFSTETNTCMSYVNEAYYRFGSNSDTPVRCVYISCHDNDICIFTSPEDGDELQVSSPVNPLHSSDECVVNFVDVIHDCMPRRVDLTLKFKSNPGDNKVYLQLQRTTPLSYFEGELFKADVTCDNEYGNGKLFFKHNGTRNLLEKGSFDNIPAYDPSSTSCSVVTTNALFTSTHTASEISTRIMSPTTTLVPTITSHVQSSSPTSTARPAESDGHEHQRTFFIAAGVGVAAIIVIIIVAVVIYVGKRRRSEVNYIEIANQVNTSSKYGSSGYAEQS